MEEIIRKILAEELNKLIPLLAQQKTVRVPQSIKQILKEVDIGRTTLMKAKKDGLLQAYKFKGSSKVYFYLDEVIDLFYPD